MFLIEAQSLQHVPGRGTRMLSHYAVMSLVPETPAEIVSQRLAKPPYPIIPFVPLNAQ